MANAFVLPAFSSQNIITSVPRKGVHERLLPGTGMPNFISYTNRQTSQNLGESGKVDSEFEVQSDCQSQHYYSNHAKISSSNFNPDAIIQTANELTEQTETPTRRLFFSSVLLASSVAVAGGAAEPALADVITWTASPVNKRSGITVFKAEETFNLRFITYLSRFLLSFDEECQKWWYKRAADIPRTASSEQVDAIRLKQFGQFSASVEVGLQEYDTKDGPRRLLASLLDRYGKSMEEIKAIRSENGLPALKPSEEERQKREIREAKRQIALLFGLLQTYQPTEEITKLLASIDNGFVKSVKIENPGSGYAPGYGSPRVVFPPPEDGEGHSVAKGRAVLTPSGRILRIDLSKRGLAYSKAPTVTISAPISESFGSPTAKAATAKAFIYRDGVNKGKVERIHLTSPGSGYVGDEPIKVVVSPPDEGGTPCVAKVVLEYEVRSIQIDDPGKGYATEKPLQISVDAPPLTARVNLNDPIVAQGLGFDGKLESSEVFNPSSLDTKAWKLAKGGGGGGCVGRACYDDPVVAIAYAKAENDSYNSFRADSELKLNAVGNEKNRKPMPFWKGGNSQQLLSLLPAGIGLIYNSENNRYDLVAGESVMDYDYADAVSPGKPIDPDFGPRGRSPIEREKKLDAGVFSGFYLSGALCASSVHLILTPIDVVKTNIQTDSEKYPGPISAFKTVLEETGPTGFFAGWIPTFVGFFIQGGVAYTAIEFFRRYYSGLLGDMAVDYEVPIILAASVSLSYLSDLVADFSVHIANLVKLFSRQ